jgi:plasmid maintenance system killer protein
MLTSADVYKKKKVLYPHSKLDMIAARRSDEDLYKLLGLHYTNKK